ncbi:MAG: DUF2059 domain-containing protein [Pseudomonadota bacterium]
MPPLPSYLTQFGLALMCAGLAIPAAAEQPAEEPDFSTEPLPPLSADSAPLAFIPDPDIDPAARAIADEIVAMGYPVQTREDLFFATMDQTVSQVRSALEPSLPQDDPGAIAILDDWIDDYTARSKQVLRRHIPHIMAGMVEAYATIFTVQELGDILAFVRTPSGQRYFELSPAIVGSKSFAAANQRYMDESLSMLGPAQRELQQRLNDYLTDKTNANAAPTT